MGLCLCRRTKHFNIEDKEKQFLVMNVNDSGKKICPGILELTETSLIFHIKRGGFVKWPYISLVKYGYNSNLFSFVCNRRCQTGEGIFGFRCNRAEELFNLLHGCVQNNRISVISDTDCDLAVDASKSLPYRSETYPTFPDCSTMRSSSQRPQPIGSELPLDPPSIESSDSSSSVEYNDVRRRRRLHIPVQKKVSDSGVSQMSVPSYTEVGETNGIRRLSDFKSKKKMYSEELKIISSGAIWDKNNDVHQQQEGSHNRSAGYENVSAILQGSTRSRTMLVSVSSSDSQCTSCLPAQMATDCFVSQPSSPLVFEERYSVDQKIVYVNEDRQIFKPSPARTSLTRHELLPTYFNFDLRPSSQESKVLNYIQVEVESGCDSDNPQTPQTPNGCLLWPTGHQSECYIELDLEKTAALSMIQKHKPKDDGTRRTRHNSKHLPV